MDSNQNNTNNTKQAMWVAIGSFFSFIVGIISPMILSRFFCKADYGTYKQVMYVYSSLLVVFTLGLPRAYSYFLPKKDIIQSKDIITKLNLILLILGLFFSFILFIFAGPISTWMNNEDLAIALRVFAPVPALLLPTMGLEGVLASFKKTEKLAIFTVITRVITVLFTVLPVVAFSGSYIEAIIGFDIAAAFTCLIALFLMYSPLKEVSSGKTDITFKEIFYFAYPLLMASIWGMIIESTPQFFISRYFGSEVFADFSNGWMKFPFVGMVTSAIATVLLPVFSGLDRGKGLEQAALDLWINSIIKSAKIIFPMIVFCIFFAKLLMTTMYGDLYDTSTAYFQIKNFSSLFFILPFAPIMIAVGKTREYARLHFITAILIVLAEIIVINIVHSSIMVAIVSELCQIAFVLLMMRHVCQYAHMKFRELLPARDLLVVLLATIISGSISFAFCNYIHLNKLILLCMGLTIYLMIYYIICWMFRISYKEIASSITKSSLIKFIP